MELDPEARRILSLVHDARTPGADDKARVEQRLALALGASAAVAASSAGTAGASSSVAPAAGLAKTAGSGVALKWTLGGCALLAAAVATYGVLPDRAHQAARAPRSAPASAKVALPQVPPAEERFERAAPAPEPEATELPVEAKDDGAARVRRVAPRVRSERGALGDELTLLHSAQRAWRAGDAARALSLVSEHRAQHPRSALGVERDALRVLALCDLGRTEEAARLGRAWLAHAGGSPLRASIERSCAMK